MADDMGQNVDKIQSEEVEDDSAIGMSSKSEKDLSEGKKVSDLDRIKEILVGEQRGMKAAKIADLLDMSKKEINRILYANKDLFVSDLFKNWKLK